MHISFTKLGHEKCGHCKAFELHNLTHEMEDDLEKEHVEKEIFCDYIVSNEGEKSEDDSVAILVAESSHYGKHNEKLQKKTTKFE